MSQEFIFKKNNGKLEFVGNFEALYQFDENPWGQSGDSDRLAKLYKISRDNLVKNITDLPDINTICEIGCGLGYVTELLNSKLINIKVDGVDISKTAIAKAKNLFPNIDFFLGDITKPDFSLRQNYDIIILNQILWYILQDLKNVFANVDKLLNGNGYIIISTLFLKEQNYGVEIIGSFDDLLSYCLDNYKDKYRFIYASIDYKDTQSQHMDSILILQKK